MKKITLILIMSAIMMTSAFPVSFSASTSPSSVQTKAFTHTMFAELGTELPCPNCHIAREALHKIYTSNDYPFYYVSIVDFVNDAAAARIDEFNIGGYPTVWFDGGYRVDVGGLAEDEQYYRQSLADSGIYAVSNIDVNLSATWLGNAQIDINIIVFNYESSTYNGHIHVYVTEVESTMGWNDTFGHPYTFPFLDYAFNQDISMISHGTWTGSLIWDGHNYNDGQGHDFGNIQFGNLQVIAVVFNSEIHQGFSDPPSENPFDAYYVDNAAGVWLGTPHPPAVPSNPNPVNGATNIDVTKDISWTNSEHEDIGEDVYSDLYFGTTNPPPLLKANIFEMTYDVGIMQFHTKYYWKIVAHDNHGQVTEGPIWSFTTASVPDFTPPTVTIEKPKNGYLYFQNNDGKQCQLLKNALIIGKITIEVNAIDTESGIDRILFLIDGKEQAEITTAPYTFLWTRFSLPFISHTISVVAYDEAGNNACQNIKALKIL